MNFLLEKVTAREILDSRGNPTVEVDAFTSDGQRRERRYRPVPVLAQERQRSAAMGIQVASAEKGSVMPLRPWRQKSTTQSGEPMCGSSGAWII